MPRPHADWSCRRNVVRRRFLGTAIVALAVMLGPGPTIRAADLPARTTQAPLVLDFFWTHSCPHCVEARAFLDAYGRAHPWLDVREHELSRSPDNRRRYAEAAARVGKTARYVPAFVFCEEMVVGFSEDQLQAALERCRTGQNTTTPPADPIVVPWLGELDPDALPLPVYTIVLGGIDGFNPCAFFVLLFLLSLLAHARSRARIALVGGIFVVCSGLVYFLFMAAWLNAFLVFEELRFVTAAAGTVAVTLALINIKDFFWLGSGPSLSIPERAKPGLYRRMRGLVGASSLPTLVVATVTLALAANSYELLCTAGLPLVFTRILTLHDLPTSTYYLYLGLYNVTYVMPLTLVVIAFVWTLGSRKLREQEGRVLKLLSGLMMLSLGLVLIVAPDLLQDLGATLGLLVLVGCLAVVIVRLDQWRTRQRA